MTSATDDAPPRRAWFLAALLVGAIYFVVGRLFGRPTDHVQAWRLAAWAVSGIAYAAHICYEHFRLRNSTRVTALHVAVAVAVGAFGLAVAGMMHSRSAGSPIGPAWLVAMVAWPALTALPAFLGALVAGAILVALGRRSRSSI